MIRLILFHLEDTLIDPVSCYGLPLHYTGEYVMRLKKINEPRVLADLMDASGIINGCMTESSPLKQDGMDGLMKAWFKVLAGQGKTFTEEEQRQTEAFLHQACLHFGTIVPAGNLILIMNRLQKRHLSTGVYSDENHEMIQYCLHMLGLQKYMCCELTRADMKDESFDDAAYEERCGCHFHETLFVSQRQLALKTARVTGMRTAYYDEGRNGRNETYSDDVIYSLRDLLRLSCLKGTAAEEEKALRLQG